MTDVVWKTCAYCKADHPTVAAATNLYCQSCLSTSVRNVEARLARVTAALKRWTNHLPACPAMNDGICTCGYDEAKKVIG